MTTPLRTWPALDVAGIPPADAAEAHDAVQGDLLEATLTDFDVEAIDESAPAGWRVFFRTSSGRDRAQRAIAAERFYLVEVSCVSLGACLVRRPGTELRGVVEHEGSDIAPSRSECEVGAGRVAKLARIITLRVVEILHWLI